MRNPGLFWSQSMVENICYLVTINWSKSQKNNFISAPFSVYVYGNATPQTLYCSEIKWISLFNVPSTRPKTSERFSNLWKTIWLVDESDVRGQSDSFSLKETEDRRLVFESASEDDWTRPFHSISGGSNVHLECLVRDRSSTRCNEKAPS